MSTLPSLDSSFLTTHYPQRGICIAQGVRSILSKRFDFDVYLPSRGMNLQRGHVWTLQQKQALIESVLIRRHIPPISAFHNDDEVYEVIDGKQRLSALIDYLHNRFEFCGYLYKDLPELYSKQIARHYLTADLVVESSLSDDDKIEWFRLINFAGTPQDSEHIANLTK